MLKETASLLRFLLSFSSSLNPINAPETRTISTTKHHEIAFNSDFFLFDRVNFHGDNRRIISNRFFFLKFCLLNKQKRSKN